MDHCYNCRADLSQKLSDVSLATPYPPGFYQNDLLVGTQIFASKTSYTSLYEANKTMTPSTPLDPPVSMNVYKTYDPLLWRLHPVLRWQYPQKLFRTGLKVVIIKNEH
jgi:hypothetical protein